jgi:dihydrofolate reductase
MRRIINSTNVSLDGVVEIMGTWPWHFEYVDDAFNDLTWEHLSACDALLMGRRTYESFAEAWPSQTGDYADRINSMKKYVASTTLKKADWTNSTVIDGDLVDEVTKIKELPGQDILMFGFGPVARTLLQHGLLDEIRLWVHPVLVGAGSRSDLLFREGNASRLKLVETKTLGSGIVILSYQPAAESASSARDS